MKIKIDIKDKRRFNDVALLIDRDDFWEEVIKARKKLKEEFKIEKILNEEDYHDFRRKIKGTRKQKQFDQIIEAIRKTLRLPVVFTQVIRKAVFCGEIKDKDYSPAYLEFKEDYFDIGNIPDYTYYIVLSPKVTDDDVLRALWEYRDNLGVWKTTKNLRDLENLDYVPTEYKYIPEVYKTKVRKGALKNHRCWYWARNSGLSFEKIWELTNEKCPIHFQKVKNNISKQDETAWWRELDFDKCTCDVDKKTVRDGIDNYRKLIGGKEEVF